MFVPEARGRRQRVGSGRSASTSSAAARSGSFASASMRGLGDACCSECAGLGDINGAIKEPIAKQIAHDWASIVSLGLGMVSLATLVFMLDKQRRRRVYRRRRTPVTQELPAYETMSDVVWGRRR